MDLVLVQYLTEHATSALCLSIYRPVCVFVGAEAHEAANQKQGKAGGGGGGGGALSGTATLDTSSPCVLPPK
eukprot:SAG22_NODE_136_length_18095_cov_19.897255_28_plen_72_part_00